MVRSFGSDAPDFWEKLRDYCEQPVAEGSGIEEIVSGIVKEIATRGDEALLEFSRKFDHLDIKDASALRVPKEKIEEAANQCDPALLAALKRSAERIATYNEKLLPQDISFEDEIGNTLGNKWTAIDAVGIYVPGGLAAYPSSVLMNAVPAKVAGVKRMVMVVPSPRGVLNPVVLAAAHIAGVDEIYTIGGAQAVAALAFGTETVPKVDKIAGPGNAFVAEAKKQLFGTVGIDMIAGPSEVLVVADDKNDPRWIAADLLSQAEHDVMARSILLTSDVHMAKAVSDAIDEILKDLPRKEIAEKSWHERGLVIIDKGLENLVAIADLIAAEHLELAVDDAEAWAQKISHAGAIFIGRHTPEAMGDYIAGPSHVLPTSGTARFSSGLSVFDFLKRTSLIQCSEAGFAALAAQTACFAEAEGLQAHALSVTVRGDD